VGSSDANHEAGRKGVFVRSQELGVRSWELGAIVLIVATKLFIEPGTKAPIPKAFERERPRIVNNFAASASPGYELSSF
jgi:hypothetical protein